ncbi:MAG: helix-turn-helix transcriptional regulator [Anaerofustis stercorihominis]|nr:helix-turn-helix transcriptional regulator [Anaerofustis stercorihominis]
MSTGQRIALIRKNNNLSQEAFGEMMGVSRQAISKWESDTSVPDIDNLVSIARQFDVSVGWLLGVEEDNKSESISPEKFAVELKKYSLSVSKKYRLICILLMILVGVLSVLCLKLANDISSVKDSIVIMDSEISDLGRRASALSNEMSALYSEDHTNALAKSEYNILSVSPEKNTAKIYIAAIPSYSDAGTKVRFIADDISVDSSFSEESGRYSAVMEIPMDTEIIYARITNADSEWVNAAVYLNELKRNTDPSSQINLFAEQIQPVVINDDGTVSEGKVIFSTDTPSFNKDVYGISLRTEKTELLCYYNGKLIMQREMTEIHESDIGITLDLSELFAGKVLRQWDSVYFTVKLTDNYDRVFYSDESASCVVHSDTLTLYPAQANRDLLRR